MKPFKFFFALIVALFALTANAANYFESKDSCEAAWHAGKTVDYKPTGRHVHHGIDRISGMEKRQLEGDACILLGAQPGKRWVFIKQGTEVHTHGANVRLLAECQNDIFEVIYLKKSSVAQQPATPPAVAAKPQGQLGRCDWTDPKSGTNIVAHGYSQSDCVGKLTVKAKALGYEEICKANLANKQECLGS
ncbi:MAG: hypothetical protein NTW35_02535 [Candidatus Nomurabacteria bacterium]|nr:hypothetical protein [Candidatus Nomurabacteria bacterium]